MDKKILEELNPAQYQAVVGYQGPTLIIAGAGSGKTKVLTLRIAYMISEGISPRSIMALTFTNKAATQMRERIINVVGKEAFQIQMGTFHSVFAKILRQYASLLGYTPSYTIYDESAAKHLLKTIIKQMGLDGSRNYEERVIGNKISMLKNNLITPERYQASDDLIADDYCHNMNEFQNIYKEYCRACKANDAMDFDDILLQTNILFRDHSEVLEELHNRYKYFLVDEYQDTNSAQYMIISRLAEVDKNICVVGDDSQSIYAFRGAVIDNILNFKKKYSTAKIYRLEQNYRSTQIIVDAANSVIAHNENRLPKQCFSCGTKGTPIRIFVSYTDGEEAEQVVADIIKKRENSNAMWSDYAILYRNNSLATRIETALRNRRIPYKIYRGNSFYDHAEVRDFVAYLRIIINTADNEALLRIINTPTRGIGDKTINTIADMAKVESKSMWSIINNLISNGSNDKQEQKIIKKVAEFVGIINELIAQKEILPLPEFAVAVAEKSTLLPYYKSLPTLEAGTAVENIESVITMMQEYYDSTTAQIGRGEKEEDELPTLEGWLQEAALTTDADENSSSEEEKAVQKNKITLMTIHSAKGTEFRYVYIVGCDEQLLPSRNSIESAAGLEEERRLFYVALTRAKEAVTLTHCENRYNYGQSTPYRPSRFLNEIDKEYIDPHFDLNSHEYEEQDSFSSLQKRFDVRYSKSTNADKDNRTPLFGAPKRQLNNSFREQIHSTLGRTEITPTMHSVSSIAANINRSNCEFEIGDRVQHAKFGYGTISNIEQSNIGDKLTINFGSPYGTKTILPRIVKLIKV